MFLFQFSLAMFSSDFLPQFSSPGPLDHSQRCRSMTARPGRLHPRSCRQRITPSQLNTLLKNSILFLLLGGAALQRCGNHIALNPALAAEGRRRGAHPGFQQEFKPLGADKRNCSQQRFLRALRAALCDPCVLRFSGLGEHKQQGQPTHFIVFTSLYVQNNSRVIFPTERALITTLLDNPCLHFFGPQLPLNQHENLDFFTILAVFCTAKNIFFTNKKRTDCHPRENRAIRVPLFEIRSPVALTL